MFNPTQYNMRNFFFDIIEKVKAQKPLSMLEQQTYSIILEHPEYYYILNHRDKYLHYQWDDNSGDKNPFLHLSMHLTILEQLSINQPTRIREIFNQFVVRYQTEHNASHELMECIAEMLIKGQFNPEKYDENVFYHYVNKKLGL